MDAFSSLTLGQQNTQRNEIRINQALEVSKSTLKLLQEQKAEAIPQILRMVSVFLQEDVHNSLHTSKEGLERGYFLYRVLGLISAVSIFARANEIMGPHLQSGMGAAIYYGLARDICKAAEKYLIEDGEEGAEIFQGQPIFMGGLYLEWAKASLRLGDMDDVEFIILSTARQLEEFMGIDFDYGCAFVALDQNGVMPELLEQLELAIKSVYPDQIVSREDAITAFSTFGINTIGILASLYKVTGDYLHQNVAPLRSLLLGLEPVLREVVGDKLDSQIPRNFYQLLKNGFNSGAAFDVQYRGLIDAIKLNNAEVTTEAQLQIAATMPVTSAQQRMVDAMYRVYVLRNHMTHTPPIRVKVDGIGGITYQQMAGYLAYLLLNLPGDMVE